MTIVHDNAIANISKPATQILISFLSNLPRPKKQKFISSFLNSFPGLFQELLSRMKSSDYTLQTLTLTLINLLLTGVEALKVSECMYDLDDLGLRNLLSQLLNKSPSEELKFAIFKFETILKKELYQRIVQIRLNTRVLAHQKALQAVLESIRKSCGVEELSWKDLGVEDPFRILKNSGVFGLECLYWFISQKPKQFEKASFISACFSFIYIPETCFLC